MPDLDRIMLDRAALAGLRGWGAVEPNPMVGCVIGRESGEVLAIGHHRRFGGPHAEVEALEAAQRAGHDVRGATAWVTLEPCSHHGKTPPCVEAILRAGLGRVVAARRDPNPVASGGGEKLVRAGVSFVVCERSRLATGLSESFARRLATGLPWTIGKWAHSIDGRVATSTGSSRWISGSASRRRVHALRGRVDAVMVGIGTVLADDPMLTARGVRPRRAARRVVIDGRLSLPIESALVRTAREHPLTVVTRSESVASRPERQSALESAGVEVLVAPGGDGPSEVPMRWVMLELVRRHGVSSVLVEGGPRLLGRLFHDGLIDEAWVFQAPLVIGDSGAPGAVLGGPLEDVSRALRLRLIDVRRVGVDVLMRYRRA